MKTRSIYFPPSRLATIRANADRYDWARQAADSAVAQAEYWRGLTLDETWDIMFSHTIKRSWFVWSDGHCPSCGGSVPMYTWVADAVHHPWKLGCPHCGERFPKNDFHAYYRSGLNARGVFDEALADASLLFNEEHPDADDPLHLFGVDGGHGYEAGGHRWWFVGAYLVWGQWKQLALGGVKALSAAYAVTRDIEYARRCMVLLDRVADVFPGFSFLKQGVMYDVEPYVDGFVSYSVDHCMEMKDITLAYDAVFDAARDDEELVRFLFGKARTHGLENAKACFGDIRANIEENLLITGISDPMKLDCNFPWEHIAKYLVKTVTDRPETKEEQWELLDAILRKSTGTDGVSGEKGLTNYSAIATMALSMFLAQASAQNGNFLADAIERCPGIRDMYRFFTDALCLGRLMPTVGDAGYAGHPALERDFDFAHAHKGFYSPIHTPVGIEPSALTLLGELYRLTGDADFIRMLWHANGRSAADLPRDINCADVEGFQRMVAETIAQEGEGFRPRSANKQAWHLALLRSGRGAGERLAWLSYDMRGADLHGHCDGLNLGLIAKGLVLLPDFGYPPVQYGGWFTPQSQWYAKPSAHNTVVVDGQDQVRNADGRTLLWSAGQRMAAVVLDGAALAAGASKFERTTALISVDDDDCYLFDVFRVAGGHDHAFFLHGPFGTMECQGLNLQPAEEYGHGALLRNFRGAPAHVPGWHFEWKAEDRYGQLGREADIRLRYTGLTSGMAAHACEAWVNAGDYNVQAEAWIPAMMLRRQSQESPLKSTFAGIIEPFENRSNIASIRRLPIAFDDGSAAGEGDVAVEVELANGRRDLIVSLDTAGASSASRTAIVRGSAGSVEFSGALCLWSAESPKDEWRIPT